MSVGESETLVCQLVRLWCGRRVRETVVCQAGERETIAGGESETVSAGESETVVCQAGEQGS